VFFLFRGIPLPHHPKRGPFDDAETGIPPGEARKLCPRSVGLYLKDSHLYWATGTDLITP